ncbi:MAG: hypothetical protein ACTSUQ_05590 [Candidatus Freyarchaeota archaeon]
MKSSTENDVREDTFGTLEILVGDGKTGISVYTVGGGKTNDIDMSTGLVFALEQAIREHSGTAKDVFFGGINFSGGIGWCVKEFEVAGEKREFYIGVSLTPGCSYSLDIDTLEQKNKGKREFFLFLKDFLLPGIVRHLDLSVKKLRENGGEATLDTLLGTGASAFRKGDPDQIVKSPDDLGDSWKVFSEACSRATMELGTILRAISVRKGEYVDSRRACSEMISAYLDELYEAQNIDLEKSEWSYRRVLGPLRSGRERPSDAWMRHIVLTGAESLFQSNPSSLLLLGEQKNFLNIWNKVLREKIHEWGTKRKDFLIGKRYGSQFLDSVKSEFELVLVYEEEINQKKDDVLNFLAASMAEKIFEEFPLTALTYDAKKAVVKGEMLEVIREVVPAVEREVIEELFEEVKEKVFDTEKFVKSVFSRKKTETMRKKMDEWTDELYESLREELIARNPVFSLFPEPLEQFKTRIADFINEKAIIVLKDDVASAILLAVRHLEPEAENPVAAVYLNFVKELVKGFVGKDLTAVYPTLGYFLKEANVLDKLDDAFNGILKDTEYESVNILENVSNEIKSTSDAEVALKGNAEKANEARLILREAAKRLLARGDGLKRILVGDEI